MQSEQLELKVYYTAPGEKAVTGIDPELGIRPQWGEMATAGYEYDTRTTGMLGALRFLRAIVADHPDLVIISGYVPLLHVLVALYAWSRRVPVGLRSDTTLQHSKTARASIKGLLKRFILRVLFKVYSTAHPVGTLARENLLHYGVFHERMFAFPYAVNNEWFCAESSAYHVRRSELRREMGIAENAFVVLGILKFHEREDPVTLVLGFAELLARRHDSCHLLLVGDGPLRGEIEAVIHGKGILHVTLPGYAPYRDLPKYYAVADVFVHPGVGESWGVSVNESMACGVPVVLSDRIGSHVDLVREGETGFVFQAKDPISLAECLETMASDRTLCETMGNKARVLVEDWGYEATERSLLKALRYVLPRMRGHVC
ncbi:MAG: glycosyltransferase family 4 protein [Thermoleophilia bacterium]